MHWVCACISFIDKRFEYYDSLHGSNPKCLAILRDYLISEAKDKKGMDMDLSDWIDYSPRVIMAFPLMIRIFRLKKMGMTAECLRLCLWISCLEILNLNSVKNICHI